MKLTDKEAKTEELLEEYKDLVKAKASLYFMLGADKEDIVQEGMIGLYKAIQNFDGSKGASFKSFAELCITRQIVSAIVAANRKKYAPLNTAVSLDKPVGDDENSLSLGETLVSDANGDPANSVLAEEMIELILSPGAKILSEFERKVLLQLLDGNNYQEIAKALGKSPKQIDNTIQRIRTKLRKFY